jgi:hypothetical protein
VAVKVRWRRAATCAYLIVAGVVLLTTAWTLAQAAWNLRLESGRSPLFEWTVPFHNPKGAALLPYAVTCVVAFVYGLLLYAGIGIGSSRVLRRVLAAPLVRFPWLLAAVLLLPVVVLSGRLPPWQQVVCMSAAGLACLPWRLSRGAARVASEAGAWLRSSSIPPRIVATLCVLATAAVLAFMSVEPFRLSTNPVRLTNEYPWLPEQVRPRSAGTADRAQLETQGQTRPQRAVLAPDNDLERFYQASQRGQVNHIGHILNPIGEHAAGKPTPTYFQYGVGATFIFKWVMDLFGGPSIQAYYRTAILYVPYWLLFVACAAITFRDTRYVLASAGLLAATYYSLGYEGLVLAPGINPILHFLDLPVLLVCLRFFRTGGLTPLVIGGLGAALAVAVNTLFGGILVAAFLASSVVYLAENGDRPRRLRRVALLVLLLLAAVVAVTLPLPRNGGASATSLFLTGMFSWRPPAYLVIATIAYLAASYLFLLHLRQRRDPLKYLTIFLFTYAQGFLTYYYWSGLDSHFWPTLPFIGLHLLLMLHLAARSGSLGGREPWILAAGMIGMAVLIDAGSSHHANRRRAYRVAFERQVTHEWTFPRASVIATGDPAPIASSIALIARYSDEREKGICILSAFNNLLPFLADRYSILPSFELQWSLTDTSARRLVVAAIEKARPPHVFVGHEVEQSPLLEDEPAASDPFATEWRSNRARMLEIWRVFDAVRGDYERIESGDLLTVYRRRDLTR